MVTRRHARRTPIAAYDFTTGRQAPEVMARCKCGWESGIWTSRREAAEHLDAHITAARGGAA